MVVAPAGCLRSTTTIDLRPDGTGTVVQETAVTSQALAMLKGFSPQQTGADAPSELFGEEQARKAAATMGVTFVSGEPFKTGEMEGYRARYSFDDIAKVKVNMQQQATPGVSSDKQPPFAFTFDRGATASVLTIEMPEKLPGGTPIPGMPTAGGTDAEKAQAAQALGMMKAMMRGMFVDVSLNVTGRILKTNAPHVEGSRVTLLQIDLDKMLADEAALQKLQAATDLKGLTGVPGLKVPSGPTTTIQFSR